MDSFEHKKEKDDGIDSTLAGMEAADTGKEHVRTTAEETKQQQQQQHSSHSHGHHHHNQREEEEKKKHVGAAEGSRMDLVDYVDLGAATTAGAFLEMRLLKATGKTYDKREWLIGPEQVAKDKEEETGGTDNKKGGTIYEF